MKINTTAAIPQLSQASAEHAEVGGPCLVFADLLPSITTAQKCVDFPIPQKSAMPGDSQTTESPSSEPEFTELASAENQSIELQPIELQLASPHSPGHALFLRQLRTVELTEESSPPRINSQVPASADPQTKSDDNTDLSAVTLIAPPTDLLSVVPRPASPITIAKPATDATVDGVSTGNKQLSIPVATTLAEAIPTESSARPTGATSEPLVPLQNALQFSHPATGKPRQPLTVVPASQESVPPGSNAEPAQAPPNASPGEMPVNAISPESTGLPSTGTDAPGSVASQTSPNVPLTQQPQTQVSQVQEPTGHLPQVQMPQIQMSQAEPSQLSPTEGVIAGAFAQPEEASFTLPAISHPTGAKSIANSSLISSSISDAVPTQIAESVLTPIHQIAERSTLTLPTVAMNGTRAALSAFRQFRSEYPSTLSVASASDGAMQTGLSFLANAIRKARTGDAADVAVSQIAEFVAPKSGMDLGESQQTRQTQVLQGFAPVGSTGGTLPITSPVSIPSFVHRMTEMIQQRLDRPGESDQSSVVLRLDPPELGRLNVHLSVSNDVVSIRMVASEEAARQVIERQLGDLQQSLTNQGVSFTPCQVDCQGQGQNSSGQSPFQQSPDEFPGLPYGRQGNSTVSVPQERLTSRRGLDYVA